MAENDNNINIKVEGLDKLVKAIDKFPEEIKQGLKAAGEEAAKEIIQTEGLKQYPPMGPGNQPPTPYYVRGVGTQLKSRNLLNSEKLGTQFYTKPVPYGTEIGNRASYAKYVVGQQQTPVMGLIGWRKLYDVATEKIKKIREIYQGHVNRIIRKLDL